MGKQEAVFTFGGESKLVLSYSFLSFSFFPLLVVK